MGMVFTVILMTCIGVPLLVGAVSGIIACVLYTKKKHKKPKIIFKVLIVFALVCSVIFLTFPASIGVGIIKDMMYAQTLSGLVSNNNYDKAIKLINSGTNPDQISSSAIHNREYTPLIIECRKNNFNEEFAKVLIEHKSNINVQYPDPLGGTFEKGYTPLMYASWDNNIDAVKFLLNNGADVNIQADNKNTALFLALLWKHIDIAKLLSNSNIDISAKNDNGQTVAQAYPNNVKVVNNKLIITNSNQTLNN